VAVAGAGAQEVRHFNKKNAAVRLTRNPGQLCGQSCPGAGAALGQGRKGASPDLEAPRLYPALTWRRASPALNLRCSKHSSPGEKDGAFFLLCSSQRRSFVRLHSCERFASTAVLCL